MSIICLTRNLSLIDTDAIWLLSLVYLLMRVITSFLRYTGYLNFIKYPKQHFTANSSPCTTTELSCCLTAIKNYVVKYYETVYYNNGKNLFCLLKSRQRTCNGFVLQMAHFYSKKSIVKKSIQNDTKWYLRVSSLMPTIYFLH